MRNDHHRPPITTNELHHQSPSNTTRNIPHTPSPITPTTNTNTIEFNSTPESRLAASISQAILNIPATSFQDAATITTTSPHVRTTSDTVNQDPLFTTNTTPPKISTSSPLRRAVSDAITTNYKPKKTTTKKPIRRALSDTRDYQQHKKTKPESSTIKSSPCSEKMRKIEEFFREIEQIMRQEEETVEDENLNLNPPQPQPQPQPKPKEEEEAQEECVAVERVKNGDLKFDLSCCCGKHFEMLIKQNGYCFYRLT